MPKKAQAASKKALRAKSADVTDSLKMQNPLHVWVAADIDTDKTDVTNSVKMQNPLWDSDVEADESFEKDETSSKDSKIRPPSEAAAWDSSKAEMAAFKSKLCLIVGIVVGVTFVIGTVVFFVATGSDGDESSEYGVEGLANECQSNPCENNGRCTDKKPILFVQLQ
jgi:hypothetical protein